MSAQPSHFSRTLSLLRQERGISQRQAARELGISQALLSHYENGIREPGLAFVRRACDFYGVSADFILGRTLSRDGTTIVGADTLYDVSEEKNNVLKGSVMATLYRKLIVNSVGILFDLLGQLGDKNAIRAAADAFSSVIYILYRHLHTAAGDSTEFFSIPQSMFYGGITRADMIFSVSAYMNALEDYQKSKGEFPSLTNDDLEAAYPGTYQSLLQIIHTTSERMSLISSAYNDAFHPKTK